MDLRTWTSGILGNELTVLAGWWYYNFVILLLFEDSMKWWWCVLRADYPNRKNSEKKTKCVSNYRSCHNDQFWLPFVKIGILFNACFGGSIWNPSSRNRFGFGLGSIRNRLQGVRSVGEGVYDGRSDQNFCQMFLWGPPSFFGWSKGKRDAYAFCSSRCLAQECVLWNGWVGGNERNTGGGSSTCTWPTHPPTPTPTPTSL